MAMRLLHQPEMIGWDMARTLSSLDVYRRLTALGHELEEMAGQCWSPAGETALRATAKLVRACASGFWLTIRPDEAAAREDRPAQDR